jgi:hypothetical protein
MQREAGRKILWEIPLELKRHARTWAAGEQIKELTL